MSVTKKEVINLRRQGLTYEEIGRKLGITRQRAHQIRTGSGLDYRKRVKVDILTHYGNGELRCIKCGFDNIRALTLDHIDGDGRKHKRELGKKGTVFYNWIIRMGYPQGYQTLCMNCQWIKWLGK